MNRQQPFVAYPSKCNVLELFHFVPFLQKDQYSKTNVMYFLFSLLRIKGLYMFRALLPHPQEALHKQHLVYCMRVMSVGCYQGWNGTEFGTTYAMYQVLFV
jgi:hypothetical protein